MINFTVPDAERVIINDIAERAVALDAKLSPTGKARTSLIDYQMDLCACHANGCPLDLERLLKADDFDFAHDVFGIGRHLDRRDYGPTGGQLLDCFLPRFAAKCQEPVATDPPMMKATIARKRADYEGRSRR